MNLSYLDEPSYFVFYFKKKKKKKRKGRKKEKKILLLYKECKTLIKPLLAWQPCLSRRCQSWSQTSRQLPALTLAEEQERGCRLRNEAPLMQRQKEHRHNSLPKADNTQVFQPSLWFVSSECSQRLNQHSFPQKSELTPLRDLKNSLYFIYSIWSNTIQCDIKLGIYLN